MSRDTGVIVGIVGFVVSLAVSFVCSRSDANHIATFKKQPTSVWITNFEWVMTGIQFVLMVVAILVRLSPVPK